MYFLFSGEGPADLGGYNAPVYMCQGDEYSHGPMTMVVDQIILRRHHYSFLSSSFAFFAYQKARKVSIVEPLSSIV